jgi:transposase
LADVKARTDRSYEETVREAVTLYRIAATVNLAPLKLVSEHLGVSVSTATRMMARAREAGLAVDLITRETYNRLRTEDEDRARPHQVPGSPSGPSIGR